MNNGKVVTEKDYEKMTQSEKDRHHAKVREDLIEAGLIRPQEAK